MMAMLGENMAKKLSSTQSIQGIITDAHTKLSKDVKQPNKSNKSLKILSNSRSLTMAITLAKTSLKPLLCILISLVIKMMPRFCSALRDYQTTPNMALTPS
uniref:Uncharacterized protein n=1 Tax=Opuntia streptacantha TaxID=393608 RepID=A0A7C9DU16_OPUST